MAYKEYNARGGRSRQPAHIRIYDRIRDLHDNYRLGWLLLFAAMLYVGHGLAIGTFLRGGRSEYWEDVENSRAIGVRVENGAGFAKAAGESSEKWFFALTAVGGLGNNVPVAADRIEREVSPAQTAAFDRFAAAYAGLEGDLIESMLDAYRFERKEALDSIPKEADTFRIAAVRVLTGTPRIEDIFPDLQSAEELRKLLHAPEVHLFDREADGLAYVGLSFTPEWSVNPFGAILHGERILWAGSHPDSQHHIVAADAGEDIPDAAWLEDPRIRPGLRRPAP